MATLPNEARRPAEAYYVMQEILPPEFFVASVPPKEGVNLAVMCRTDNVVTQWDMAASTAAQVEVKLRKRADVWCQARPYKRNY